MRVIVAGGGNMGTKMADFLAREGHDVVVIEKNEKVAEELGGELDALVLCGDASDRKILKDGNIERCDVFVAMTGDDKANLLICEVVKSFNVPIIVTRVNDSSNESIFSDLGISATINTTTSAILALKKILEEPGKITAGIVADGKAEVLERVVQKKSKIIGKKIDQIRNRFVIAAILRKGELIKPKPETKIAEGDSLVICAPVEEVKNIDRLF